MTPSTVGIFSATLSGILYGLLGWSGLELVDLGCSISEMLFWRFIIASLFLMPMVWKERSKWPSMDRRSFLMVASIGAATYCLSSMGYFAGAEKMGSGIAMVLFYVFPAMIAVYSAIFKGQRISKFGWAAIIIMLMGMGLLGGTANTGIDLEGMLLVLAAAAGYATFILVSHDAAVPNATSTFIICIGGALGMLFATKAETAHLHWEVFQYSATYILAIVGTLLPMVLLLKAMETIKPFTAAMLSTFEPITTVIVGVILRNEAISTLQWAGIVAILSAAVMVQRDSQSDNDQDKIEIIPTEALEAKA